jgi:two-component system, OmpR family, phosphate regulon response regulator PhoB
MGGSVLLIHDDAALRQSARRALETAGYGVTEAPDLVAGWRIIETAKPEVLALPWASSRDTRDTLLRLREREATRNCRIVVLAEQGAMSEVVAALEFGADDCVALPLEPSEFVARVGATLRRAPAVVRPDQLTAGPLVLDKAMHCLWVQGSAVALAPTEFRLLAFLLENQGRVFSRDELLRRAWSKNVNAGHRTVDVHVRRLRQLLEPFACDDLIQTVRGFGYRLAPSVRDARASSGPAITSRATSP